MLKQNTINVINWLLRNRRHYLRSLLLLPLFAFVNNVQAIPAQVPLYLTNAVTPIMMLNMSTDHQLYFKVYDDYGDLTDTRATINGNPNPNYLKTTGDGSPDTTYVHNYQYYGYFDSKKCYKYSTANSRFEPSRAVDPSAANLGYCNYGGVTDEWSGNFLNWVTMTRIDVVRKILYGGLRKIDTATETVLERSYLPTDAHSYTKYYRKTDLTRLVPAFTVALKTSDAPKPGDVDEDTGITFCNVTGEGTGYSQDSTKGPLIRVAKGNYSLWASNERWQCRWGIGTNGNRKTETGINAYADAPDNTKKLTVNGLSGAGEFVVRVQVCKNAALAEENCVQYPSASYRNKPTGLLQKYGETNELNFALITGSHGRNKSGGVLRKNAGNMLDEINTTTDGTFQAAPAAGGIINTLNLLRLYGYAYDGADPGAYRIKDSCGYGLTSFSNGNCSNWGNPQSEIYYESLRYLGGFGPTTDASNDPTKGYTWIGNEDQNYIAGLKHATWPTPGTGPVTNTNYCAPLNILQFNASVNSYDTGDDGHYPKISDIGLANTSAMDTLTDLIGDKEGIKGTLRFVGKLLNGSGDDLNQLCTAKTVNNLSKVSGTCPDSPRLNGGYGMAGLAKHARDVGIKPKGVTKGVDKNRYGEIASVVRTYGVGLAPSIPKIEVPVPGSTTGKKIIIQPACRNHSVANTPTNCAIVDFKIVGEELGKAAPLGFPAGTGTFGTLYVSWEDSEQGADYDQDMWGVIKYFVTPTNVTIQTRVLAQSSDKVMGFGYIITGTNDDGFHVQSGVNNFTYPIGTPSSCTLNSPKRCTCATDQNNIGSLYTECNPVLDGGRIKTFTVGSSTATFLPSPLYYAAKWGGYSRDFEKENSLNLDDAIKARDAGDSFFYATDPNALASQLESAFQSIASDIKSAGGVATNNPRLSNSAFLFQTRFFTFDWTGELRVFRFQDNGLLERDAMGQPIVKATTRENGKIPPESSRLIYTNNITASPISNTSYPRTAATFTWANLTAAQKASLRLSSDGLDTTLAEKRLNWLRGKVDNEVGQPGGIFRKRTDVNGLRNVLGDLVNSSPVYLGAQDYGFSRLPGQAGLDYAAYVKKKIASKRELILVGSNDGMLHAFNAESPKDADGKLKKDAEGNVMPPPLNEVFAYIPQTAYAKLANLTRPDYGRSTNSHKYIVDGPMVTSDVYINNEWRTIVVGTLGAGGRGVYALDVTEDVPKILFEFSETTCMVDASVSACPPEKFHYPQLGYVLGMPVIAPMTSGRFAVIFGNGDLAGTGQGLQSSLFVIDIEKPFDTTYSKVITTDTSKGGTGLSSPEVLPNSRGQAVSAYAGDLAGNLWHFNLSGSTGKILAANETPAASNWKNDYLLFQAKDDNGNVQPIFATPTIGYNPANSKLMIYFGTGKYYDTGDNVSSLTPVHSVYAIADMEATVDRKDLKQKLLTEAFPATSTTRTENTSVKFDWGAYKGWYFNLPSRSERAIAMPILVDDKLIFSTLIPIEDPCLSGGDSWIMELEATGTIKLKNSRVLKKNVFNPGLILGSVAMGRRSDGNDSLLASDTDADILEVDALREPSLFGRQSWRQLR